MFFSMSTTRSPLRRNSAAALMPVKPPPTISTSHSMSLVSGGQYLWLLISSHKYCPLLTRDIECDVLIVGGGFTGISAAAEFLRKGLRVVLIEKNIVGGSSSGRSAGFLTPDSELELHQLVRRYGTQAAAEIWDAPLRGIERLVSTIKKHDIQCGLL